VKSVVLAVFACAGALSAGPLYTIQQIGPSGSSFSIDFVPSGMNASGQVSGSLPGRIAAFWDGSNLISLAGTLPVFSEALDINDLGQLTGYSPQFVPSLGGNRERAFRIGVSSDLDLGTLGGPQSRGLAINNNGEVTGYSTTSPSGGSVHAFVYRRLPNGTYQMSDLGTLGGASSGGEDINDSGVIAGYSQTADPQLPLAVVWNGTTMTALPTLGGASGALGINDNGWVTGYSNLTLLFGQARAFLWDGTTLHNLGSLGYPSSVGRAINSSGHVVGYLSTTATSPGADRAFVYDGSVMYDLNSILLDGTGWLLRDAVDINDAGQIVGHGFHNGLGATFILTPVSDVPEPGTWALALTGLAAVTTWRRRKR
jgi:probable HAF family extracellular repeat protein